MYSANHLNFNRIGFIAALACLLALGCGGQGGQQALNQAMTAAGKQIETVYPLAGNVTIDSQAPNFDPSYRLVVVLNEPDKLDLPTIQKPHVEANKDGGFSFGTYATNDGFKPGKYIVTFGVFRHKRLQGLVPPDQLHNLYRDPEANAKIPEFVIDHKSPGKKNYEFNLQVAGKEPAEPGSHALNGVFDEGDPGTGRFRRK